MRNKLLRGEDFAVILLPRHNIRKIYVEVTSRCNLNCRMCYRRSWKDGPGDMSMETFSSLLNQLTVFHGLEEMVLGGIGEPFFNPEFSRMLEAAAALDVKITITTNGTLLDSGTIGLILQHGVHRLVVSVDSTETAIFASIRNAELKQVLEAQQELKAIVKRNGLAGPRIAWEFVVMKSNCQHLPGLVNLAAETGVEEIYVSHLMPLTPEALGDIIYGPLEAEFMGKIFNIAANTALARGIRLFLPRSTLKTERRCRFVDANSAVIGWNGDVAPCYRFLHNYREFVFGRAKDVKSHAFGNINDCSLEKIWSSDQYALFRYMVKNSLYPSCTDCDLVNGCDTAARTDYDCMGNVPACGDCLWARGIVFCP